MNEAQTELVEWEEVSLRCWALRLRTWDVGAGVRP